MLKSYKQSKNMIYKENIFFSFTILIEKAKGGIFIFYYNNQFLYFFQLIFVLNLVCAILDSQNSHIYIFTKYIFIKFSNIYYFEISMNKYIQNNINQNKVDVYQAMD